MKKAYLKQLHEETLLTDAHQLANLFRRAIAEFDAVHPFSYEDAARTKLVFHLWHVNVLDLLLRQQVAQLLLIRSFV